MFFNTLNRACAEIKTLRKWPTSFGFSIFGIFFRLSFFSFSFLFAAVIDLPLGLLIAVKRPLRKCHWDGRFLPWSSQVLVWVFHSTFWAFLCISQAPFGRSLKRSFLPADVEYRWFQLLFKSDDVRSGRKAKARHGWLWAEQESVG